jgi:hypothetical protein
MFGNIVTTVQAAPNKNRNRPYFDTEALEHVRSE